jgi:transposase
MAKAKKVDLSASEKAYLESIVRARTSQVQHVQRARIVLFREAGMAINAIAEKVELNRKSVMLCLDKYFSGGLENALNDAPGRGRNPEITDDEKAWIINIACQKPYTLGYAAETWSYTLLTGHINKSAEGAGYLRLSTISRSCINSILDEAEIKPFRIRYYCENRDPEFEAKMHDVLFVYKQIEMQFDEDGNLLPFTDVRINTLSYDEKPGIQAIANTSPDRMPTLSNGYWQRDYEYKRLGTLSLLAGIDLLTGEAIPHVSDTHASADFIDFLKKLDTKYPQDEGIRLILDNHSVHTSQETRDYLATKPGRFDFVFTPKHGSWLNLIEGFFGKMTRQMLRGIRVSSKQELSDRIYKYFDEVNKEPVVYHWKYMMKDTPVEVPKLSLCPAN